MASALAPPIRQVASAYWRTQFIAEVVFLYYNTNPAGIKQMALSAISLLHY